MWSVCLLSLFLPPCVPTGKDIGALVSNVGSGAAAAAAAAPSGGGGGAEEEKKEVEEEKKKEESEEESDEDMGFGMCVCVRGQRGENEGEAVCGTRMCVRILCHQPYNYIQSVILRYVYSE